MLTNTATDWLSVLPAREGAWLPLAGDVESRVREPVMGPSWLQLWRATEDRR
jgi:hypothetical protein